MDEKRFWEIMTPSASVEHSADLYTLRPHREQDYYCGRTADGGQFLLGPKDAESACVVLFDSEGNYLGWQERALPADQLYRRPPPDAKPEERGDFLTSVFDASFQELVRDLGCRLGPISIRTFFVNDLDMDIGVHKLPWYLQRLIDDPEKEKRELGDVEFERVRTMLSEWIQRGDYVLTWGSEHHVNKDGEIVFS